MAGAPLISGPQPEAVATPTVRTARLRVDWSALILSAWAGGSLIVAAQMIGRVGRFQRILARGWTAPADTWATTAAVAERIGVRPPVAIRVVPGLVGPLVWCLGRPTLVLPREFEQLSPTTQQSLLAHELAHLARGDHWVARLELLVGLVWWWNPVFRLARRRVRRLAEASCDARVVRAYPESRFAYAEALVVASTAARSAPVAFPLPALGIGEAARTLEARLTMILRDPVRPPTRWLRPLAGSLVALALPSWTLARQDPAPAASTPPAAPTTGTAPAADGPPTGEPPPASPALRSSTPAPILAEGVTAPPVDPAKTAPWTIETIAAGVDGRPQPNRSLAFRHTATYQLTSPHAFVVNNEPDDPGVGIQAADIILGRRKGINRSELVVPRDPKVLDNEQHGGRNMLGCLFRIDALEADRGSPPGASPNEPETPRPDWLRWFAATQESALTFRVAATFRGPVAVRWLGASLDNSPPATDDLTPHFYTTGRADFGDRPQPGTGPLRLRPESLIDLAGPMVLLFRSDHPTYLPLLTPSRQLAGVETIDGVEVVRVAWLANDSDGLQGLAWVAPSLAYAVVRFEATTTADAMGRRVRWRRTSSGYRPVGDLWLPERVEYRAETVRPSPMESPTRLDLVATFEDYRVDAILPTDTFTPKLAIGALDPKSGAFTAEPPPVPTGLAERLQRAIASSPFGSPRRELTPPGSFGMGGGGRSRREGGAGGGRVKSTVGSAHPAAAAPVAANPAPADQPAAIQPATILPATIQPATILPLAGDPGPAQPTEVQAANGPRQPELAAAVRAAQRRDQQARRDAPDPALEPDDARAAIVAADQGIGAALLARRATLRAELKHAEAERRLAQAVVSRNQALSKKLPGSVSPEEMEKAQSGLAIAEAEIVRVQAQQAEAEILSERPTSSEFSARSGSPSAAVMQARRDVQAAELARVEADDRIARVKFDSTVRLAENGTVNKAQVELSQAELDKAQAAVQRERAKLAEADALLADMRGQAAPTASSEPSVTGNGRSLADLRDEAELLAVQISGKQDEIVYAKSLVTRATRRLAQVKALKKNNAIGSQEVSETEQVQSKALADLATRDSELRQLALRLQQTKARIEAETANLRRRAGRAKDRRDWSRRMRDQGTISRAVALQDAAEYDDLMSQLDPHYQPEAEPEPKPIPEPTAGSAGPAVPAPDH